MPHGPVYNATAEAGVVQMTRTPEFIDSYQYANLYNEARANDGLSPFYSQEQLKGYQNTKGANDLLYPNVDLYNMMLNKNANYRKVSFDVTGGTDRVRYALIAGYTGGSGFEDVAYTPQLNRLTLRGNLDFKVTDFLSVSADVAGRMRRWLIPLDEDITGVFITRNTDGTFTFEERVVEKRKYEVKNYFAPLPYAELVKNRNLINNQGWE